MGVLVTEGRLRAAGSAGFASFCVNAVVQSDKNSSPIALVARQQSRTWMKTKYCHPFSYFRSDSASIHKTGCLVISSRQLSAAAPLLQHESK